MKNTDQTTGPAHSRAAVVSAPDPDAGTVFVRARGSRTRRAIIAFFGGEPPRYSRSDGWKPQFYRLTPDQLAALRSRNIPGWTQCRNQDPKHYAL